MILGIFDSGLGGLTVLKEILKNNSYSRIVYFGDTARVPYGDKDKDTLRKYAIEDIAFLKEKGVDEIVVACGTISSTVLNDIKDDYDFKIEGIIDAAVKGALDVTKNEKIGVIATSATINTHIFRNKIENIYEVACPKFVPLIENNLIDSKQMEKALDEYLSGLKLAGIDTLILGCTHYPLLKDKIDAYFDGKVSLINSGTVLSKELFSGDKKEAVVEFYVSGDIDSFKKQASRFLDIRGNYAFYK